MQELTESAVHHGNSGTSETSPITRKTRTKKKKKKIEYEQNSFQGEKGYFQLSFVIQPFKLL